MSDEELEKLGISTHQVEVRRTILMPRGSYKTTRETKRKITLAGRSYDHSDDDDRFARRNRTR